MMVITKKITLPDGRIVVVSASYKNNYETVTVDVTGPVDEFLRIVEENRMRAISGPDLLGCYNRLLEAAGCKVEDSMNGEWEMCTE